MSALRLVWRRAGCFHMKTLTLAGSSCSRLSCSRSIFATIAFYLFGAGGRPGTLLYAALGAGMMGIWSSTLFGSGGAIQWQRWQGTLELLVAAPPPFLFVLLPLTLATATVGLYSLTATLVWGRVLFDVPLDLVHPFAFVVAVPATVLGARAARPAAGVDVHPLPARERALEPARVPGLARHRAARPGRAAARLGRADLVAARADLGRAGDPRRRDRRRRRWPAIGMCLLARRRLPRARDGLPARTSSGWPASARPSP